MVLYEVTVWIDPCVDKECKLVQELVSKLNASICTNDSLELLVVRLVGITELNLLLTYLI